MKQRLILLFKFYFLKFLSTFGVWKEKEKSILIIRDDRLGDFLISLPFFQELKKYASSRNWKLIIIVRRPLAELADKTGLFDKVLLLKESSFKERLSFYRECAKFNAVASIVFPILRKSLIHDYIALIPSPRYSYVADTRNLLPTLPAFLD